MSGTITVDYFVMDGYGYMPDKKPEIDPAGTTLQLLVDGVPQRGWTIDTRQWPDGTHHIAIQVVDRAGKHLIGKSRVVVFRNDSSEPLESLTAQVINEDDALDMGLAFARLDVGQPVSVPLGFSTATHPVAATDADGVRLATQATWWVDGFSHQSASLYSFPPILAKNRHGDYFVAHYRPRNGGASKSGLSLIEAGPQYDGPRGVGMLSSYSTCVADPAVDGWLCVDVSGRVVERPMDGSMRTIYGPRSVAGVIGTDPNLRDVTLSDRIAMGEKELVRGDALELPQDLAVSGDTIWLADTGKNAVMLIDRAKGPASLAYSIADVSSVWHDAETGDLYAAAPAGLFRNGDLVARIPDAFWVRGGIDALYVLTRRLDIWRWSDGTAERVHRIGVGRGAFVFMEIDVAGRIGPKGRIYYSNSNGFQSNTRLAYVDPGSWNVVNIWHLRTINSSFQSLGDHFGHYLWGLAIHPRYSVFLSTGLGNTSWRIWTAHLGPMPTEEEPARSASGFHPLLGRSGHIFTKGIPDVLPPLERIYGGGGHGFIGYSVDTYADAASFESVMAAVDAKLPAGVKASDREAIGRFFWWNRTRKHFQPRTQRR